MIFHQINLFFKLFFTNFAECTKNTNRKLKNLKTLNMKLIFFLFVALFVGMKLISAGFTEIKAKLHRSFPITGFLAFLEYGQWIVLLLAAITGILWWLGLSI